MKKITKHYIKVCSAYCTYFKNKIKYAAPHKPHKFIDVKTDDIKYYMAPSDGLKKNGDLYNEYKKINKYWGTLIVESNLYDYKIESEKIIDNSWKYQSVNDHFINNTPWIETRMFVGQGKIIKIGS